MWAGIKVGINERNLSSAIQHLTGIKNGLPLAIMRAINRTLSGVKTDAQKAVKEHVTLPMKHIRPAFYVRKASKNNMAGYVAAAMNYKPALIDYRVRPKTPYRKARWLSVGRSGGSVWEAGGRRPKKGVSGQIFSQGRRQVFPGSFVQEMASGHVGIFRRTSKDRLPIRELFGPSVPDVLRQPDVLSAVEAKAQERLNARLDHEVQYLLSKKR